MTFNATKIAKKIIAAIEKNNGLVEFHLDVESTSLRGTGFAFGGFVRQNGKILGKFALLSKEGEAQASDWVKEKVLPHLKNLPTVETQAELYQAYWKIYSTVRSHVIDLNGIQPWETGKLVRIFRVVWDNGSPVEVKFEDEVISWATENAGASEFDGAYMPIDISTSLSELGYHPDLPRSEVAEKMGITGPQHHPEVDCEQSCTIWDAANRKDPRLDQYKL